MSDYMILGMSTELVSIKELMKGPVCQAQRRVVPVSPVFVFRNVSTWVKRMHLGPCPICFISMHCSYFILYGHSFPLFFFLSLCQPSGRVYITYVRYINLPPIGEIPERLQ